jgi:hypothetical protein
MKEHSQMNNNIFDTMSNMGNSFMFGGAGNQTTLFNLDDEHDEDYSYDEDLRKNTKKVGSLFEFIV